MNKIRSKCIRRKLRFTQHPENRDLNTVSDQWKTVFDRIYVVSLPASTDRRRYISEELRSHDILEFEWHDAFDSQSPQVRRFFDQDLVHLYPPCFRCGNSECGQDDCNNVLLPAQVAVFVTYLELCNKIAQRNERVLVLEDDVRFHQSWRDVLPVLDKEIEKGRLPFRAELPCLLRMGWALGEDHDKLGSVRINSSVRMSNPCFGITSAYAAKAVLNFKKVDHTADVYLHQRLPESNQAFTIFPPIASELSWSTGELASLIHPKAIHADYLERMGDQDSAAKARKLVCMHPKHIYHRQFLVIGHPRTGTGYAASLLRQLGFDVGHEKDGTDGLSSWMFAADDSQYPYAQDSVAASRRTLHWNMLLLIVRDPRTAIPSIMRDNIWAPLSYQFRREHIAEQTGVDLDAIPSNLERAIMSLVCWSRMALAMKPDFWFRLEHAHEALPHFLARRGLIENFKLDSLDSSPVNAEKLYQGRKQPKPHVSDKEWCEISPEAVSALRWYCDRFGYFLPKDLEGNRGKKAPSYSADPLTEVRTLFFGPSGWERSRREMRPVRADGSPLPWFTFSAIEFLHRIVDGGMRVFEYGAGYGTLWWQRAALVHSIDHDPTWISELRPKLGPNVELTLVEQGAESTAEDKLVLQKFLQRPHRTVWNYPRDRIVRRGLEDREFLAYAAQIRRSQLKYDVVIIDGMARRLCTEFAVDALSDRGIIILDNSNRSDYDAAYDILNEAKFFQIPFWGLVPGADFFTCTSVFARHTGIFPDARFQSNSFGLPEY